MSPPAHLRRGWCPDVLRPMETADGLLVRVHPRGAKLSASQAFTISDVARRFGNGLLDLSSRGNIQIRGVTPDDHPRLAEALVAAGLLDGVRDESPFRLTTVSPLAGIDPRDHIDASVLAEQIEEAGRSISGMHPKISVAVDGGGAFPLDEVAADLRVEALDATRVALGVAGPLHTRWAGVIAIADVPAVIGRILARVAANEAGARRRLREIDDEDLANLLRDLPLGDPETPPARVRAARAGPVPTGGQTAFFLVPPYGRCNADGLFAAAACSTVFGSAEIRLSPFRALAIPFVPRETEDMLGAFAHNVAGFIVEAGDRRLAISACPGREGCARGSTSTHADADRIAASIARLPAGPSVHVSGCAKGCAHPAPADVTLVGDGDAYEVVLGGTARDKPLTRAGIDAIAGQLAACSDGTDLMRVFGTGQQ